ncbi:hypothetical protein SASPL_115179 [Salvia splendens]|uniref:Retrovirus-related Pol polyprotein from transposon TNT 1-94 n=1 Tax=Salvia splendens TaxID=180675 RepID=A0A8X8Y4P3_SALSN|nr:hypothetical protein SASPL_115179 [Salvia splendens]
MVEEVVEELCSKEEEAEEDVPNPITKTLSSVTNAINLGTINISVHYDLGWRASMKFRIRSLQGYLKMNLRATRPNKMFVVSLISRYISKPTELHLMAAKRILRYIQRTTEFGILYRKGGIRIVAWSSRKQPIVILSTTEAEFVAAAACSCQAMWMKRILKELGYEGSEGTTIFYDNCSMIKQSKNPVMHCRSKHINVRFHFLRELSREGVVQLKHCGTQEHMAEVLTKPLKLVRDQLGFAIEDDDGGRKTTRGSTAKRGLASWERADCRESEGLRKRRETKREAAA